jgi:hypothetical protein
VKLLCAPIVMAAAQSAALSACSCDSSPTAACDTCLLTFTSAFSFSSCGSHSQDFALLVSSGSVTNFEAGTHPLVLSAACNGKAEWIQIMDACAPVTHRTASTSL